MCDGSWKPGNIELHGVCPGFWVFNECILFSQFQVDGLRLSIVSHPSSSSSVWCTLMSAGSRKPGASSYIEWYLPKSPNIEITQYQWIHSYVTISGRWFAFINRQSSKYFQLRVVHLDVRWFTEAGSIELHRVCPGFLGDGTWTDHVECQFSSDSQMVSRSNYPPTILPTTHLSTCPSVGMVLQGWDVDWPYGVSVFPGQPMVRIPTHPSLRPLPSVKLAHPPICPLPVCPPVGVYGSFRPEAYSNPQLDGTKKCWFCELKSCHFVIWHHYF